MRGYDTSLQSLQLLRLFAIITIEIDQNMIYAIIIISILCVLFSLFSFLLFGREEKVFSNIQTEPPRDLNPLEIALIYNKRALPGDAVALLHYLASKDYLKILRSADKKQIILTKLKNYDGNNAAEKYIFENVFATKAAISLAEIKNNPNITYSFQVAAMAANSEVNTSLFFSKLSLKLKSYSKKVNFIGLILVNILVHVGGFIQPLTFLFAMVFIAVFCLFQGFGLYIIGSGSEVEVGFGPNESVGRGKNRVKKNIGLCAILMLFIATMVIAMIVFYNTSLSNMAKLLLSVGYIGCLTLICISQMISSHIDKKTSEGIKIYQEIAGFKEYLDKAERPMLEKLYNESPNVFRKIISFGFVLGVSKKWIENFDNTVFNSIFSTAYGHTDDEGKDFDYMTDAQKQAAYQAFQEKIRLNRNMLQTKIDTFNNMIKIYNLVLFNNIYKKPLKMPSIKLSKYLSGDK